MEEYDKKRAIVRAVSEMECYPIPTNDVDPEQYTKLPIGELSALGVAFSAIVPALQSVTQKVANSGVGEQLYRMVIPKGLGMNESLSVAKGGGLLGNIVDGSGKITQRARFVEAGQAGSASKAVLNINPAMILMAIAIATVTKKLDRIEDAQKEIIEFLQLQEKAKLKGNIAVLQDILNQYKYNWDNENYKRNKHMQVQEIKRDAEQSIIFSRDQIERKVSKKAFLHSDRDVKAKIQKVQYEFKDYELAMYIFSFSSFLEVMLLENFNAGYLNSVTDKIETYADKYHELRNRCYEQIEGDSKTSIQAYALKGVANFNKMLGNTIAKIPKISDSQVDEHLMEAGNKVQRYNTQRTENTMTFFAKEYCTCVRPFVDNINTVNQIYNEPMELLFDNETVYFCLTEAKC